VLRREVAAGKLTEAEAADIISRQQDMALEDAAAADAAAAAAAVSAEAMSSTVAPPSPASAAASFADKIVMRRNTMVFLAHDLRLSISLTLSLFKHCTRTHTHTTLIRCHP